MGEKKEDISAEWTLVTKSERKRGGGYFNSRTLLDTLNDFKENMWGGWTCRIVFTETGNGIIGPGILLNSVCVPMIEE